MNGAGSVAFRIETPLGFTTGGRVARLNVQEGDQVKAGQLLAALDPAPLDANLASARAEQLRADAELRRSESLLKQGWVTQIRVDNARASARVAAANVRAADFQTATARIVAPSSGEVLARVAEPGQVIAAGAPALVLGEARGGLVMRVALSDHELARISRGAPAQVSIGAMGSEPLAGTVIELGGRAERATGAYLAEIAIPASPGLRSGMIGSARIAASPDARSASLTVSPSALFAARAGEAFVYVIGKDRRARLRKVSIAEAGDGGVVVSAGLSPGEWVAVAAIDRLRDGMRVAPVRQPR